MCMYLESKSVVMCVYVHHGGNEGSYDFTATLVEYFTKKVSIVTLWQEAIM